MEEALIGVLLANAGVAAEVGTRVYPAARPQDVSGTAITMTRITGTHDYTSDGPTGLKVSRLQMDAWSTTYRGAKLAARAAIAALSGIRGDYGGSSIHGVFVEDEADQPAADGSQNDIQADRYYRVRVDLRIWHTED